MILMLAFLSVGVSTAQTPPAALAELVDQAFILPKVADSDHIELEADKLDKVRGSCDRAVLVRRQSGRSGRAHSASEHREPIHLRKQGTGCRFVRDRMVLKIKGFTEADPGASTINSIRRVLLTPEDFLRSRGIPFTLLPGSAPQDPVKISDGDLRPKPL
jgi:hypothetical protein